MIIWLCAIGCGVVFAGTDEDKISAFHLSFVPPLSTHGVQAGEYTNRVSFNILAGVSKNEKAFTFGGLANWIGRDAQGVQFAGLGNYTGHNAAGFQFAGLSNYVGNKGEGMLFAGLMNLVGSSYEGVQFAGLFNKAKTVEGIQFGGLGNYVENGGEGIQFAGLMNLVGSSYEGVQFAGLFNKSGDLSGCQFAGLVNMAKNVSGVQFSGLVNIAESSNYPIGIINIIKNGEKAVAFTYDETGSLLLTFRSGGRVTYGIIGAGYNHKTSGNVFTMEAGLGAHINCLPWLRINNEIKATSIGSTSENPAFKASYALLPAFKFMPHFEIFAGPTLNFLNAKDELGEDLFPSRSLWKHQGETRSSSLYVGYQFGVQYIF